VVCTQGGESVAGLKKALEEGTLPASGRFVLDSTSHQLKFSVFQQMYFDDTFAPEYGIRIEDGLKNRPVPLQADTLEIARHLGLKKKG
jgi:threonine synthase